MSMTEWILLGVGAALVGIGKTAIPGIVMVSAGLFATVLPARESTAALLLLLLVGDVVAVTLYTRQADWRALARLLPSVVVGVAAGAAFLAWADNVIMERSIGAILLVLTVLTVALMGRDPGRLEASVAKSPVAGAYGALGGFTTMAANAGGPVVSLYFLASRFDVTRFLGTQAWFFFIVNLVKLPFSASIGLINAEILQIALRLSPIVLACAFLGRLAAPHIPQRLFNGLVLLLTAAFAISLLI